MRRLVLGGALVLLVGAAPARPPEPAERPDWGDRAVELLQGYLRIDTTNPPGNEARAVAFLEEVLRREGIPCQVDAFAPGRANLLATLRGSGAKPPLVLVHHSDVVPADPARWSVPPFSGALRGGALYGRGAQDMKTEGILHLVTLLRLERERVALDRDVLLLATADEEDGFSGALRALTPEGFRARLEAAEYVLTEGGENLVDEAGRVAYFGVDTAEKGPFWLTLRTAGTPGHGSQPIADSALNRLVRALDRIRVHRPPLRATPGVERFFRAQAARLPEPRATWYRDLSAALRDPVAVQALSEDREASSLLRNTVSITVVRAGYKTNVIPGSAEAELDVRLLPGEDPQGFLAELRRTIDDPSVEVVPPASFRPPNQSPADGELFATVEAVLGRRYPGVPVTPKMLSGATECVLYRPLGARCYGFTPLLTTRDELETAHGDDERVREAAVREAAEVFYEVVRELVRRR
jgi:acetylornithine deacetylase/succinyl-diaminopimelate desuccinylase-like protein